MTESSTPLRRWLLLAALLTLAACSTASPSSPTDDEPSAGELQLLAGARTDLQAACTPVRADLPPAAVASIACSPGDGIAEVVTLVLFQTREDLMDAYGAALTAHQIEPRSHEGRCVAGRSSEGGYVPGDDNQAPPDERSGCFVDAEGKAHFLATLPPFVMVEVDGLVDDVTEVERWAWLGNQDQPGSPTVWRSGGPASPEK